MSKMKAAFEKGKALIVYITCGDPELETTAAAVRAAQANGADLIELGIPFSDPTAEGPVIQESSIRALQGGITTDKVLAFVKDLRKTVTIPLVFKTYANVVFSYGPERFFASCSEAEVDGIVLPDLPYEEKEEFMDVSRKYGVKLISMIAPAKEERIAQIASEAEGFVYVVPGHEKCVESRSCDSGDADCSNVGDEGCGVGNNAGSNAGNSVGSSAGCNAGNSAGNSAGCNAGNSAGNSAGCNAGNSAGNSAGCNAGNSADNSAGNITGNNEVRPKGNVMMNSNCVVKDLAVITEIIRRNTDVPCAIFCETGQKEQMAAAANVADGVIVEECVVNQLAKYGKEAPYYVGDYARCLKEVL